MNYSVHKTAIIDTGAQIGVDTRIWHWVHICAGAIIGERCSLGQNVFIGNKVIIGNNVKIQNNVSVYVVKSKQLYNMNIEVIWQNGVLKPLYPVQFSSETLVITVPDEEIIEPLNLFTTLSSQVKASTILAELDAIRSQPLDEVNLGSLTEKQQERWKAFEFRKQLRQEQGRII